MNSFYHFFGRVIYAGLCPFQTWISYFIWTLIWESFMAFFSDNRLSHLCQGSIQFISTANSFLPHSRSLQWNTLWPLRCLNPVLVVIPQILLLTSRISPGFFLCFLSTGPVLVSGSAETILGFSTALHPQQVRDSLRIKFSHSPYRIQVSGDTQVLFPPPGKEQNSTCHQVCSFPPSPDLLSAHDFPQPRSGVLLACHTNVCFPAKLSGQFSCQLICSLQLWFHFFHILSMDSSSFSIRRSPETHIHLQTSFSSKQKIIRWVPGCFVPSTVLRVY